MLIKFTRNRLRAIVDALEQGRYITCPAEGKRWEDSEILALAGACMSELMFRREVAQTETTDEPLRFDLHLQYGRLSGRLTTALNYVLEVASAIHNGCVAWNGENDDKTYKIEVFYDHGEFQLFKPRKAKPSDGPPEKAPTAKNAVMRSAA